MSNHVEQAFNRLLFLSAGFVGMVACFDIRDGMSMGPAIAHLQMRRCRLCEDVGEFLCCCHACDALSTKCI